MSSVRIEPATVGSEPILAEMMHIRKSRPEADIAKSCEIKFQWGSWGVFQHSKMFWARKSSFPAFWHSTASSYGTVTVKDRPSVWNFDVRYFFEFLNFFYVVLVTSKVRTAKRLNGLVNISCPKVKHNSHRNLNLINSFNVS